MAKLELPGKCLHGVKYGSEKICPLCDKERMSELMKTIDAHKLMQLPPRCTCHLGGCCFYHTPIGDSA